MTALISLVIILLIDSLYGREVFLFDQCGCSASKFVLSGEGKELVSDITTNGVGLSCRNDGRGITKNYSIQESSQLRFNILPSFFNEESNGSQVNNWYMVFDIDMSETVVDHVYPLLRLPLDYTLIMNTLTIRITTTHFRTDYPRLGPAFVPRNDLDHYQVIFCMTESNYFYMSAVNKKDQLFENRVLYTFKHQLYAQNGSIPISLLDLDTVPVGSPELGGKVILKSLSIASNDQELATYGPLTSFPGNAVGFVNSIKSLDYLPIPSLKNMLELSIIQDSSIIGGTLAQFLDGEVDESIRFEVDHSTTKGKLIVNKNGSFDYFPPLEFVERDQFSFEYFRVGNQDPEECVFSKASVSINILAVPKLLNVEEMVTFGFMEHEMGIVVASSDAFAENNNILQEGIVIIESLPENAQLFQIGCSEELLIGDVVYLQDGLFRFCVKPEMIGRTSFQYLVRALSNKPKQQAKGVGSIRINNIEPITINPDIQQRSLIVLQKSNKTEIDLRTLVVNRANIEGNFDVNIKILSTPPSHIGKLTNSRDIILEAGANILSNEFIYFEPHQDFFNANNEGGITNGLGNVVFDTNCPATDKIGGACPAVFTYQAEIDSDEFTYQTDPANFGIIVKAVNEGRPMLINAPPREIFVPYQVDQDDPSLILSLNIRMNAVGASQVFNSGIQFVGEHGVSFLIPTVLDNVLVKGESTASDNTSPHILNDSCRFEACAILQVIGSTEDINSALEKLQIVLPNLPGIAARIFISLSADGENFRSIRWITNIATTTATGTFQPTIIPDKTNAPATQPSSTPSPSSLLPETPNPTSTSQEGVGTGLTLSILVIGIALILSFIILGLIAIWNLKKEKEKQEEQMQLAFPTYNFTPDDGSTPFQNRI